MSMYDSNTNVRTKTSTRNRSIAQAENFLFRLFMAAAVAAIDMEDTFEDAKVAVREAASLRILGLDTGHLHFLQ